jgi:uncharacterized protein (PEP-CTERM system associated)
MAIGRAKKTSAASHREPEPARANVFYPVALRVCALLLLVSTAQAQPIVILPTEVPNGAARTQSPAPDPVAQDPNAPTSKLNYGASLRAIVTDNGNLGTRETKRSDVFTELRPFVTGSANRPDGFGAFAYTPRFVRSAHGTEPNKVIQEFLGYGDMTLGSDQFRLSTRGLLTQSSLSPFGPVTTDPATAPASNRANYKRFDLSPYFLADYQLRYRAGYLDPGLTELRATEQALIGTARSNNDLSRFGWQFSAQDSQRRFENGYHYGAASMILTALFAQSPEFRAGLSANYSKVDIVIDDAGRNRGWGPGVLAHWTPSERTSLYATAARQYYGNTGNLRFTIRGQDWTFALNGQRALVSPLDAGVLYLDPSQQFGAGDGRPLNNPIVDRLIRQELVYPTGTLFSTGITLPTVTLQTGVNASWGIVGQNNSLLMSMFSLRRTLVPISDDGTVGLPRFNGPIATDTSGGFIIFRRDITQDTWMILRGSISNWRNDGSDAVTRLGAVSASYYTRFTPNLGGLVELRTR